MSAHPSWCSQPRKSRRGILPHIVESTRLAPPPLRSGCSQSLQDLPPCRGQAALVFLPSRVSSVCGLARVPQSCVSSPDNSSETALLPFAYLLSSRLPLRSCLLPSQPAVVVIASDCLKSVSEGGGFITIQYLRERRGAGFAGIQAHLTAEESGEEGAPVLVEWMPGANAWQSA